MELTSSEFSESDWLPDRFTCSVVNPSIPPLRWDKVPPGTLSFILLFVDIDAPNGDGTYYHLILYNIPANIREYGPSSTIGYPTFNSANELGYKPPCPPEGETHRYIFILLAMDTLYPVYSRYAYPTHPEILAFSRSHQLGMATLTTIYGRS